MMTGSLETLLSSPQARAKDNFHWQKIRWKLHILMLTQYGAPFVSKLCFFSVIYISCMYFIYNPISDLYINYLFINQLSVYILPHYKSKIHIYKSSAVFISTKFRFMNTKFVFINPLLYLAKRPRAP